MSVGGNRKRKYFGTDGIRGRVGETPITPEFMLKLGWAAGRVLAQSAPGGAGKVLIGKDTRISGYMFESALQAGLVAAGVNIKLLGPMPTPAIAYLTRTFHAQAGIVISASHNLYYDNGIKFFSAQGTKLPDETECAIEDALEEPLHTVDSAHLGKAERVGDAEGRYIEFCKSTVPAATDLNGMKIVVDCAHGATYHVAPNVFGELGAQVIKLAAEPNGLNINDRCGSTHLDALRAAVRHHGAHLGIAFDGDGDRVMMIDHEGDIVDGDELLYVIAISRVHSGVALGAVVGTVMSNLGLEIALKGRGLDFKRAAVGDRYVLEALHAGGWCLGGESSGHIICLDRTTTGDGIVSALQVLAAMVKGQCSLRELRRGMVKFPQKLVNVPVARKFDFAAVPAVQDALKMAECELGTKGRVLLRASGTEPLVRVMVEGEDAGQVDTLATQLAEAVKRAAPAA